MARGWPEALLVVRHGQSVGNVARDVAEADGAHEIAVEGRDMDVALSHVGTRQAEALGRWLREADPAALPDVVLASPYERARSTAAIAVRAAGLDPGIVRLDERLRERELGLLDRLTRAGVEATLPEEAARRQLLGRLYHRPPGGESWCDVGLRVRALLGDVRADHDGARVLLVTHEVVVKMVRFVVEAMDEATVLGLDREAPLGNCTLTRYRRGSDGLVLDAWDDDAPLAHLDAPRTAAPDAPVGRP